MPNVLTSVNGLMQVESVRNLWDLRGVSIHPLILDY